MERSLKMFIPRRYKLAFSPKSLLLATCFILNYKHPHHHFHLCSAVAGHQQGGDDGGRGNVINDEILIRKP